MLHLLQEQVQEHEQSGQEGPSHSQQLQHDPFLEHFKQEHGQQQHDQQEFEQLAQLGQLGHFGIEQQAHGLQLHISQEQEQQSGLLR